MAHIVFRVRFTSTLIPSPCRKAAIASFSSLQGTCLQCILLVKGVSLFVVPSPWSIIAKGGWCLLPCLAMAVGTCLGKVTSTILFPGRQHTTSFLIMLSQANLRVFVFWIFQMRNEIFINNCPSHLHGLNVNVPCYPNEKGRGQHSLLGYQRVLTTPLTPKHLFMSFVGKKPSDQFRIFETGK